MLTLEFSPAAGGCEVAYTMRLDGRGPLVLVTAVLNVVAPLAVRADLRRAAGILSRGADG